MDAIRAKLTGSKSAGFTMLLVAYLSYTISDVLAKLLTDRYSTFEIVCFVGTSYTVFIALVAACTGGLGALKTRRPKLLLLRGFLNFINYCACYYSYSHMPIVNVYSVLFSAPMFLTFFSAVFLKESVKWQRWTAVGTGFIGVLVMLQPASVHWTPAMFVVLTTPLTSSLGMLLMRYASRTERAVSIAFFTGLMVALCSGVMMMPHFIPPRPFDLFLFTAIGATGASGFLLIIMGFRQTGTPLGAPVQYTQLVWATLAGWLIWGHVPNAWMFAGAAIVVGSGLFTFYREMVRLHRPDDDVATGNLVSSEILGQRRV